MKARTVYLRVLERTDIPRMTKWMNDPDIADTMGYLPAQSLESQLAWFDRLTTDRSRYIFAICRKMSRVQSNELLGSSIDESLIIQERIAGTEYGLDILNDLNGRFVTCFVKRKLGMRCGETDAAETVDDPALADFGRRIGEHLGHVGMLDVDVMVDEDGPCLLEINPRFGGHYPFAHAAGANAPAALLAWAEGREPEPSWLQAKPGVRSIKDIALRRA